MMKSRLLLFISFMILISVIAGVPSCDTFSYEADVRVYCYNIQISNDFSNAQRGYSNGKSDRDVKHLSLYNSEIMTMSDIFVIFPNLVYLNVEFNSLNYLDENSFKNASLLETLYLRYGSISSLKNGTFIEAQNLRSLNLNNNKLRTINIDALAPLIQLKYLHLDNNELTHINPQIFQKLTNLLGLSLANNSLNYLDENSFKNASSLEELYLAYNNISSLKNGTFKNAQNLKFLFLNNNKLRTINIDALAPLVQLNNLHLGDNELTHINPQIFQKLTNLWSLSLANNNLTELHVSTFQQLNNLGALYLSGNQLKSLDGNLLSSNSLLKLLDINDCGIQAVGRIFFDNLKLLTYVFSVGNVCIDKEFYDFNNISSVVQEFQKCFNNYDNLSPQNVVLCDYKVDPKLGYTCEMRNVTYLNDEHRFSISGTHINNHQDSDVVAVKFINSTLSKIPSIIFRKFTNLVRLSVKQVGLKKLDYNTFEECEKLKEFDASFNEISDITNNAFDKCKSLTNIDLSDNVLKILRNQVFTGTELESINLDGNKITAIEPCDNTLGKLPNLKYLSIKWNICIHKSFYNERLSQEFNRLVTPDLKVCFCNWFLN